MTIRTDYEDLRVLPNKQVEMVFEVPRLDAMVSITQNASAEEVMTMLAILERRVAIIEDERNDAKLLAEMAKRRATKKEVESAAAHFTRVLNMSNIELAS